MVSAPPRRGAIQRFVRKLKWVLAALIIAFFAGAGTTWYYHETLFGYLYAPAGGALSPHGGLPIFLAPTEALTATFDLAKKGGLVAAFPVLLVSIYYLARPMVPSRQRRFIALFVPASLLCFLGGVSFAYFVMIPVSMKFLLSFGEGIAVPTIRLTEYMGLVTELMFWLGIVFQLPPAMFLLTKLRLVKYQHFKKVRKIVPFAALIFGAILTPTMDGLTMLMVAVPIWVLYEVGLALSWIARPREKGERSLTQIAKDTSVGIWRRLFIALVMPPILLLLELVHLVAHYLMAIWDGHLSGDRRSRGRVWLDSKYRWALAVIERVFLGRGRLDA